MNLCVYECVPLRDPIPPQWWFPLGFKVKPSVSGLPLFSAWHAFSAEPSSSGRPAKPTQKAPAPLALAPARAGAPKRKYGECNENRHQHPSTDMLILAIWGTSEAPGTTHGLLRSSWYNPFLV